jgi:hypothetical protein
VVEDLVTLADVEVTLRVDGPVSKITLEPQGTEIPFTQREADIAFTVPRVAGKQIVGIQDG